jgi:hypothetical protein
MLLLLPLQLWMSESLSCQQRSTCKVVAYDYIFYDLGETTVAQRLQCCAVGGVL